MNTEKIIIANLKCSGCATTIKNELLQIAGVKQINVDNENDTVEVSGEHYDRDAILHKLLSLGYPEANEENGLLTKLKSFNSCMIGRIKNI